MAHKAALVTGSTSGIGLGIAKVLARNGYAIFLNGYGDKKTIEKLKTEIQSNSCAQVEHLEANLADLAEIESMFTSVQEKYPSGIDILVNNAGVQHVDTIETFPTSKWDHIIAVNLSASFHTIRLALTKMRAKGWGRIINISSAHGLVASPYKSAYVASKHGIIGLTKSVALETVNSGITCNAVCPGWVLTPLVEKQIQTIAQANNTSLEAARVTLISEKQPQLEMVTGEQIGDLVAFLCSESARNITGASLSIDGGWTVR